MSKLCRLILRSLFFILMAFLVEDVMVEGVGFLVLYGFVWLSLAPKPPLDRSDEYWLD